MQRKGNGIRRESQVKDQISVAVFGQQQFRTGKQEK